MLTDRTTSRRRMAFFLRGAGAPVPDTGLCFSPAHATLWASNSSGLSGGVDVPFVPGQPPGASSPALTRHDEAERSTPGTHASGGGDPAAQVDGAADGERLSAGARAPTAQTSRAPAGLSQREASSLVREVEFRE
eukprot:2661946-Prymnesium_polylepis.1